VSRGRRIALAALLATGVVVAVGAVALGYAALADPVEYASFVEAPTGGRDTGVPYEGRMQYQVPYADGGEVATIVVREQLAACAEAHDAWSPGSGLVRSTLPLDVSVLGVPRTAEVDLRFAIIYSAPPGDCAAP
jgi:hypothetical protein